MIAVQRRTLAPFLAIGLLLTVLFPWYYGDLVAWSGHDESLTVAPVSHSNHIADVEIVVASLKKEDTSWLSTHLPEWKANIYVVDDSKAHLTVPINKGHEAMVYLTYIIDQYDNLPNNIIFIHASRFAWHNDDPDYDAIPTLSNFQLPYLQESGYVNLRCVWIIGCPAEIRPVEDEANRDDAHLSTKNIYKQAYEELLPDLPVPEVVAVGCCSQFGVTRETVHKRPRSDYLRYRQWLLETSLDDSMSGRVFEFSWHNRQSGQNGTNLTSFGMHGRLETLSIGAQMASDTRVSPQGPPDFSGFSPKDVLCEVENILEHSSDLQDSLATTISPQEATFSNVIRPLVDKLNRAKCRQQILGKILVAASPDSSLRDASREAQRLILAAETRRCMRVDIATLVSAVYKKYQEDDDGIGHDRLDAEDMYLLTHVYNEYRQSGAALVDPDRRDRLQAVTTEIDELCLAAQKALTDAKDGIWLTQSELSGIPDACFTNLRTHAPGGVNGVEEQFWVPLHGTVPDQIMRDAVRGTTRHKLSVAVSKRCPANVEQLEEIVALRHEAAALLGFPDHASRRMEEKMAESVEEVERLLIDIRQNVEIYAAKEIERLLQLKRQDVACRAHAIMDPEDDEETLFAWDWAFYSQKLRQTQYSLDTARISEYFEAEHTFQEMLGIFTKLFAIKFVPTRTSTWHESVDVYEAWDNTGDKGFLGYLYVDLFTREGKYRNAQHIPINRGFAEASGVRHCPCSALMMSLPTPQPPKPTLLLLPQLRTMFHELGHAIHNLCSRTKYGIAHSRDFVEIPSLMLEHWVWDVEVLAAMGMHYTCLEKYASLSIERTNDKGLGTIPKGLALSVSRTKNLHKAHEILVEIQRAVFDLTIHTPKDANAAKDMNTTLLWNTTRRDIVGLSHGIPHESLGFTQATFGHIFRAYDAGFFAYPLSKVYAADLYNTVFRDDPLNPSIAARYRSDVLQKGSSQSEITILEQFLGRKPNSQSFLDEVASAWS
ncbi:hypothetical protein G7054_g521 [Neopestalotiopsis clavispora]|nr:hypothetical protein G7054_g521 [Neopestalotiopsis clavispora]